MAKFLHIAGVILGFLAGIVLLVLAGLGRGDTGPLVTWGIAFIISVAIAVIDGARAFPQLGMWKVGAKFEGLSDLAVILIIVILVVAYFVARAVGA